jgi:hypothetical protein
VTSATYRDVCQYEIEDLPLPGVQDRWIHAVWGYHPNHLDHRDTRTTPNAAPTSLAIDRERERLDRNSSGGCSNDAGGKDPLGAAATCKESIRNGVVPVVCVHGYGAGAA